MAAGALLPLLLLGLAGGGRSVHTRSLLSLSLCVSLSPSMCQDVGDASNSTAQNSSLVTANSTVAVNSTVMQAANGTNRTLDVTLSVNATNETSLSVPVSLGNVSGAWGGALQALVDLLPTNGTGVFFNGSAENRSRFCSSHLDGAVCDELVERIGCAGEVSEEHAQGLLVGQICEAHCNGCVCEDKYYELIQHHSTVHAPHTAEHVSPCTQLLAEGLTCEEHFCVECPFRGLCDATCSICQGDRLVYDAFHCAESEANAYDTLIPGGCAALLQSGLTCVGDFCADCSHRGFCDYACGFCEAPAAEPVTDDAREEIDPNEPAPQTEEEGPQPLQEPAALEPAAEPPALETEGEGGTEEDETERGRNSPNVTRPDWCLSFTVGDREKGSETQGNVDPLLCHSPIVWIASLLTTGCVLCSCAGFCIGYKTAPYLATRKVEKVQRGLARQTREVEMDAVGSPRDGGTETAEGGEENPVSVDRERGVNGHGGDRRSGDLSDAGSRPKLSSGHDAPRNSGRGRHGRRPSAISSGGSDGDAASQSSSLTGSSLTGFSGGGREWRRPSDVSFEPPSPRQPPAPRHRETQRYTERHREPDTQRAGHRGEPGSPRLNPLSGAVPLQPPPPAAYDASGHSKRHKWSRDRSGLARHISVDDINFDLEPSDSVHQYGSNRGNRAQSGGVGRFGHRAEPPQELRRSFVTQQVAMFDEVEDLDRKPPPAIGLRAGPPAVPGPQNHIVMTGSRRQPPSLSGTGSGSWSSSHSRAHSEQGQGVGKPPPSLSGAGVATPAQPYASPPLLPPKSPPPPVNASAGDGFGDDDFLAVIDEMTVEELRESCEELGYTLPSSIGVQEMRMKLRQHYVPQAVAAQSGASGRARAVSGDTQNWLV